MENKVLDIFGRKITIQPKGYFIKITKSNETHVELKQYCQSGVEMTIPVNTVKDFNKTPDEFILEFNRQCYKENEYLKTTI